MTYYYIAMQSNWVVPQWEQHPSHNEKDLIHSLFIMEWEYCIVCDKPKENKCKLLNCIRENYYNIPTSSSVSLSSFCARSCSSQSASSFRDLILPDT